jgi:hypothetical protein
MSNIEKSVTTAVDVTSSIFTKGVVDKGEKVTTGVDDGKSTLSCENLHEFSKKLKIRKRKKWCQRD